MAREVNDSVLEDLLDAAKEASQNAYVPYSDFAAGAAVLTEKGVVVRGALVENLVFGLAMCAERVALFHTMAQGAGRPIALALAAPGTAGEATLPCGSCLQVAVELGGMDMMVIAAGTEGSPPVQQTVGELGPGLPHRKTLLT